MTIQGNERIPEFTLGDRLRKARSMTGLTTRDFAELIGVSQVTITNAENENTKIRRITLNAWSLATGVPLEWLMTGQAPGAPTPPSGATAHTRDDELGRLTASKRSRSAGGRHNHQYDDAA